MAQRGFCKDCGTPLTYAFDGNGRISVTINSLDDPEAMPPTKQYGTESERRRRCRRRPERLGAVAIVRRQRSTGRERLTGGCQCGAVRYEWLEQPAYSSVCHCRMCQKASGSRSWV